ncbi:tetratricopeptide repeat protein [Candidatus Sumerlaeota bacterium]|nr:tetratricopeptide repeat protein [Candidatus Sumerlaeota bacterium]
MKSAFTLLLIFWIAAGMIVSRASEEVDLPSRPTLSKTELVIWNDPSFERSFAESYIAETEIEPRVTVDEREQLEKIFEYIKSDKIDKAVQLLEKELKRNEAASPVFHFTLANLYFQQADLPELSEQEVKAKLDQAAQYYQQAVDEYPKFRRAWKNLALIHVRRGEIQQALPELIRVIELGDQSSISYGLLAFAYSSLDNDLSAESAYRMAILLDPDTVDWKMGLARSFFKQARYPEAVALCDKLIEQYPNRADLWLLQANAYIGQSKPLRAAEILELVNQLGQATPDTLNMLGDIYVNEELYDQAVDSYVRAMEQQASGAPVRAINAAKALAARSALEQTEHLISGIEKLRGDALENSSRVELLKIRSRLAVAKGAGDEEIKTLEQIVELDPLDGEALILLGQHYSRHDDMEKAVYYFERAANIEGFEADAKVRHAQTLVRVGKYTEALPLLRRAQDLKPRENIQQYLNQVERIARGN